MLVARRTESTYETRESGAAKRRARQLAAPAQNPRTLFDMVVAEGEVDLETALNAVFGEAREALRITDGGIFLATPVDVLAQAVRVLGDSFPVEQRSRILDAGAGDGRVVVALALAFPDAKVFGVECDAALAAEAARNVATLPAEKRPLVARGDYLSPEPLSSLGASLESLDLVVHYPDGNERAIFDAMRERGKPGAKLVLLSPQIAPVLPHAPEERHEVRAASGVTWYLRTHSPRD